MKRLFAGMTAALLAVILVFSLPVNAISAKSAMLMDCTAERILYSKLPDQKNLIASTTKIMTAIVVCEQCNVLDRVKIPKEAVGIEGSSIYLKEGEILTVQELLYGLMLHSGNDAAVALAIYCGGTLEGFVEMMNDKAKTLNLCHTHFENPHGLDGSDHYSTARDLCVLASYAMKNPIFTKISSTKTMKIGERYFRNHNKLLWQLDGADGVKTGYTKSAGRILVSSAMRAGRRLVAVTINDPDDWNDHCILMNDGFRRYKEEKLISENQILGTIEIAGGQSEKVELLAKEAYSCYLAEDENVEIRLPLPGFVYAPVAEGQSAGFAQIYLNGNWMGKIPLVYGQTIEIEHTESSLLDKILRGSQK